MARVQFEEANFDTIQQREIKESFFTRLILGTGLVKNRTQAQMVLLVIALLVLFFSIRYTQTVRQNNAPKIIYREDIDPTVRATLPQSILSTYPSKYNSVQ